MIRGAKLLNKNKICKVLCVKNKKIRKKNYKKNREYAASGWKIVHSEGGVRLQVHWAQNRTYTTRPPRTCIEDYNNKDGIYYCNDSNYTQWPYLSF